MARHHNTALSYLSTCWSYIPTGTCLSYWYMPTLFSYLSTCLSYLSNCLSKLSSCLSYLSTCLSSLSLSTRLSSLSTCLSYLSTCVSYLSTCVSYLSNCVSYLSNCVSYLSTCLSYLSTCLSCLARLWPPGAASCRPGKTTGGRAAVGWRHSAPPWPVAELQRSPLVVCGRPCCRLRSPQNPRPCSRY